MDLTRLREGRAGRTRAWASVCVGLFGDSENANRTATDDGDVDET